MGSAQNLFKRVEKKYLMSEKKYEVLMNELNDFIVPDEYPHTTTCSMYYDTPDFKLIRASLEKPFYKEKLRVRSYGIPSIDQNVFVEVKKKYDGVVYKRRLCMELDEAEGFLNEGNCPQNFIETASGKGDNTMQIYKEVSYFLSFYRNIRPAMFLSYERDAFSAKDNEDLRITFDSDITYRCDNLHLYDGIFGKKLLEEGQHLMEIKIPGAMPLWLSEMLDRLNIHNSSFTKYGNAYRQEISGGQAMKGVYVNA